jgi:hypothetical protein
VTTSMELVPRVQAVGKGFFDGTTLTYELCEVR